MRDIKFRYKYEGPDGSFFFQTFTLDEIEGGDQFDAISDMPLFRNHKITKREQFTGLHDKNGVEIYEGDIWERGGFIGIVTFEFAGWNLPKPELSRCYEYPAFHSNVDSGEIIGNIHENPELLERN